jgi:hypothetical protein
MIATEQFACEATASETLPSKKRLIPQRRRTARRLSSETPKREMVSDALFELDSGENE